jgi:hypothetical protein
MSAEPGPGYGRPGLSGTEQPVLAQSPCWFQLHTQRNAYNSSGWMQVPVREGTEQTGSHDVAAARFIVIEAVTAALPCAAVGQASGMMLHMIRSKIAVHSSRAAAGSSVPAT